MRLNSIDQVVFAQSHGVKIAGMLDYKGQEFFISESKHGAVVSDYVHECPGWFSGLVLPPSKSPDGIRLTAALRGKAGVTSSEASELKGKDLQQLMRSGADFSQAVFEKMDFSHMNLHGLDLRGAQFIGCTMDCTDFSKARLQGARFVDCQMVSCKFKGAKAGQDKKGKVRTEFQDCRMKWCDFTDHADFSGARFVRCVGNSCYLMGTNLQGAEFTDCYLLNMDLRNAMLKEATFVSLNRATPDGMPVPYDGRTNRQAPEWLPPNFLYSDVTHTRFLNCQLSGFFFAGARIEDTYMVRSNIDHITLQGSGNGIIHMDLATKCSFAVDPFEKADSAWDDPVRREALLQQARGDGIKSLCPVVFGRG